MALIAARTAAAAAAAAAAAVTGDCVVHSCSRTRNAGAPFVPLAPPALLAVESPASQRASSGVSKASGDDDVSTDSLAVTPAHGAGAPASVGGATGDRF